MDFPIVRIISHVEMFNRHCDTSLLTADKCISLQGNLNLYTYKTDH